MKPMVKAPTARAERRAAPKPAVNRMRLTPSGHRLRYSADEGLSWR